MATLGEDYDLVFATELTPLYVDPDELMGSYPDATRMEIVEAIHRFSIQVRERLEDGEDPPWVAIEYIRAAALCSLARVHDQYGLGQNQSMGLGDLSLRTSVTSTGNNTSGAPTNNCDLALQLWKQFTRARSGMRAVVTGELTPRLYARRRLRDHETARRVF